MALYDLPQFSQGEKTTDVPHRQTSRDIWGVVIVAALVGFLAGGIPAGFAYWTFHQELGNLQDNNGPEQFFPGSETQEERIVQVVEQSSPAVVNIILTRDEPVFERIYRDPLEEFFGEPSPFRIPEFQERGTERIEVGGGSGFFVSADGMIVTNKHVVLSDDVDYTVYTNDGKSYPANVLARDPLQDIAVIKIEGEGSFPFLEFGDSVNLEIGQTVIAIGNALGEFRNTVSTGVISGLGRTITASDGGGFVETIEDVIQTDAAINRGNSGGPLLNLSGKVVGINTATALEAQSIGFAIPVDRVSRDVEQVKSQGKIVYAFLGVQYVLVTEQLQESRGLSVDYGALLEGEGSSSAVVEDSAAQKAGLQDGDIILEMNGSRITRENSLAKQIQQYDPGETVELKVLREGQELLLQATLEEREE